ncbi:hypothetical protein RO3G_03079 [Rhizopus delemar RA 99-880]|uniref:Uncharacterized protein n=1 Tax=Rhizopus delemar (strain RA 99-880 / ATCC MYA-4621 / FGSC 9543 / NRRL 43880) TaxID=246409 RepID=I1BQ95_RHIO9|nr:hypothetical protein RO3G_03079 [Rhizopus delemar RA 99-880]|eukprot:EIE78375.1 hypothetical protein RO3G_03079 [Rhizopus delemar RA 99-880]
MAKDTFFYENGHNNAYNKDRESSIRWKSYLSLKPAEKEITAKDSTKKATEVVKKAATTKTTTTKPERYLLTE